MEITLIQGLMLSVMAVIVGLDFFLEAFFIFRPLIVSTLTGLILGELETGLKVGALIELAFAGLTPAGGTQPPNPVFAGLMGTVLAHTTGASPEAALGLCLPFSFLGQYVILFYYSAFSFFMGKADKAAAEADTKALARINYTTMAAACYDESKIRTLFYCRFLNGLLLHNAEFTAGCITWRNLCTY